jgi:hypothetical protein
VRSCRLPRHQMVPAPLLSWRQVPSLLHNRKETSKQRINKGNGTNQPISTVRCEHRFNSTVENNGTWNDWSDMWGPERKVRDYGERLVRHVGPRKQGTGSVDHARNWVWQCHSGLPPSLPSTPLTPQLKNVKIQYCPYD